MGASTSKSEFKSEEKSTVRNDFKSEKKVTSEDEFKSKRKYEIPCVVIEEPVITGLHWENPDLTDEQLNELGEQCMKTLTQAYLEDKKMNIESAKQEVEKMSSEAALLQFLKEEEANKLEECYRLINKIKELDEINAWNKCTREFFRQKLHDEWVMKNVLKEAVITYKNTKKIPKFDDIKYDLNLLKIKNEADQCIDRKYNQ